MKDQKISQEEFELIEHYLNGSMSNEEQSDFEKSLTEDEVLKQKTEELRILFQAVEEQTLREKLKKFHKEIPSEKSKTKSLNPFRRYAIAASIALLAVLGIWLILNQKPKNEKLFAQYFKPDPGLITPMSTTSNYEFYRGMVDYKQAKYKLAFERWKPLLAKKPQNDTLNFYLGLSFLSTGNSTSALPYLTEVGKAGKSIFLPDVYYFIGLAYLKEGNIEKAKIALEKNGSEKARDLISKLNN
jgi:tetratricopeptide (TPR) repeat protein